MSAAKKSYRWFLCVAGMASALGFLIAPQLALADVDVTPPDPPNEVFVDQGEGWVAENRFDVWWHLPPDQQSPIAAAHYELCPAIPLGPCTTYRIGGENLSRIDLALPHAGWFLFSLWLEDGAGNVNSDARTPGVMLRFDDEKPPEAFLRQDDVWLGGATPISPTYEVEIDPATEWPMSGIRGYSITTDGTFPDGDVEILAFQDNDRFPGSYIVENLNEGVTVVRLRAVSNAGVPSDLVGVSYLRLDRTPPTLSESGLPTDDYWYRDSLVILLEAQDQEHLSGMAPAPPGNPLTEGAHLEYDLNSGSTQRLAGGSGQVDINTDGRHTLTYQAFDAAGNGSVEKEVKFKIDRTVPEGRFRALDPADPRGLRVDVEDAMSGIGEGSIEYRREGDRRFERLATMRDGGVLSARLDDGGLPAGRYEVRVVVTDVAGNEAVIDNWADGSKATLAMPLRLAANVAVNGVAKAKAKGCAKVSKGRRGKGRRKPAARRKCGRKKAKAVTALELRHGKRASSTGRLTTAQGAPIADAPIIVEGQPRSGGPFVRLGAATTDRQGNFRFAVPAGPSRTVRYRYDGTNVVRPAAAQLTTKVAAAARLKVDRRRLRNGQVVRFSGRLLGKPIPRAGKLVALQAKVGRGWRTFATPRANSRGVFKHRYRFTSTTGLRRYRFRAVVAREAAYPYEKGVSRTVKVTVRGR